MTAFAEQNFMSGETGTSRKPKSRLRRLAAPLAIIAGTLSLGGCAALTQVADPAAQATALQASIVWCRWIRLEECSSLGSVIASCDAASAGRGPRFG